MFRFYRNRRDFVPRTWTKLLTKQLTSLSRHNLRYSSAYSAQLVFFCCGRKWWHESTTQMEWKWDWNWQKRSPYVRKVILLQKSWVKSAAGNGLQPEQTNKLRDHRHFPERGRQWKREDNEIQGRKEVKKTGNDSENGCQIITEDISWFKHIDEEEHINRDRFLVTYQARYNQISSQGEKFPFYFLLDQE